MGKNPIRLEVLRCPLPGFRCQPRLVGGSWRKMQMNVRTEIKSHLVREGVTMQEVLYSLSKQYGWSGSISNLSGKLQRETLRYKEAVELADVLGYEIVWKKRR